MTRRWPLNAQNSKNNPSFFTNEKRMADFYRPAAAIPVTEANVLHACMDFLNSQPKTRIWRRNVGAVLLTYKGKKRFVRYAEHGQADLTGITEGRAVEIEVKRPGGKPSAEQLLWLEEMRRLGAIAFWCDSIDSCMRQWAEFKKQ